MGTGYLKLATSTRDWANPRHARPGWRQLSSISSRGALTPGSSVPGEPVKGSILGRNCRFDAHSTHLRSGRRANQEVGGVVVGIRHQAGHRRGMSRAPWLEWPQPTTLAREIRDPARSDPPMPSAAHRVTVIPGDGVGPEVVRSAIRVIE